MKKFSIALIVSLMISTGFSSPLALAAKPKPSLKQINEAKKIEEAKRKVAGVVESKLDSAKKNLRQLTSIASDANKKYLAATNALRIATSKTQEASQAFRNANDLVDQTHREIGKLAAGAYRSGGSISNIESLLNANGLQDLIDRLSTFDHLGRRNRTALQRFTSAEKVAKDAKLAAEQAKSRQLAATLAVAASKKKADAAQSDQAAEVAKLQRVQDLLIQELATARKVRITLEQQRQLALLEESKARTAENTVVTSKVWKNGGASGRSTIRTTSAQRQTAVDFARKQVLAGKPYVWGAQGPNSFDCSGLVYAAYKFARLGWPLWDRLNASMYYTYTKHIPVSEMQPGDLIFYSYNGSISAISHMSIYAGNGMMWEARSTKKGLRFSSINSMNGMMPFAGRV